MNAKKNVEQQTIFNTQRIYVKGSSFESPLTPKIFTESLTPKIDMQIQTNYSEIENHLYEAVLSLTLTNQAEEKENKQNKEEKTIWRLELHQAGVFTLEGFTEEQLRQTLYGFCMNLLYPYACEAISGMIVRSGFQPVYLTPMNFEILYREQLRRQTATEAEVTA